MIETRLQVLWIYKLVSHAATCVSSDNHAGLSLSPFTEFIHLHRVCRSHPAIYSWLPSHPCSPLYHQPPTPCAPSNMSTSPTHRLIHIAGLPINVYSSPSSPPTTTPRKISIFFFLHGRESCAEALQPHVEQIFERVEVHKRGYRGGTPRELILVTFVRRHQSHIVDAYSTLGPKKSWTQIRRPFVYRYMGRRKTKPCVSIRATTRLTYTHYNSTE